MLRSKQKNSFKRNKIPLLTLFSLLRHTYSIIVSPIWAAITSLFLRFVLILMVCVLENILALVFQQMSLFGVCA